jgi:fused signal recognition particle receptor
MILNFLKDSYKKVKSALGKTRSALTNSITSLFSGKVDEDTLDQLEEIFYESDLGVKTSLELVEKVRTLYEKDPSLNADQVIAQIKAEMLSYIGNKNLEIQEAPSGEPTVIFVVGVNGNGKTTSCAKLAKYYLNQNKKVILAAADTFRAAAVEQLSTWATTLGVDIVKGKANHDPSAVIFDAVEAAKARKADVLIIDTAGRLHTKTDLMQELEKMKRVCNKVLPGAPHEVLLVVDATIGQNAIDQAKVFNQYTQLSGLILTKLDGTAKGGITIAIQRELDVPVKFLGVGEGVDDFSLFAPEAFVDSLFG